MSSTKLFSQAKFSPASSCIRIQMHSSERAILDVFLLGEWLWTGLSVKHVQSEGSGSDRCLGDKT